VVLKVFPGASNCVVSAQGYATVLGAIAAGALDPGTTLGLCSGALVGAEAAFGLGGATVSYTDVNGNVRTATAFEPFDGDNVNLDGKKLPGTPDTTFNLGAEYRFDSVRNSKWDLVLRGDYYYQASSFSRIWNTGRDQLSSWDNINLSAELVNDESGFSIQVFGKNITNEEVITGAYLTDDSSGLFTNVFLNEPATYGIALTKSW
jgi:outer membrane receptor protein involved in Fe transport